MFRNKIFVSLIILLIGCVGCPIHQLSGKESDRKQVTNAVITPVVKTRYQSSSDQRLHSTVGLSPAPARTIAFPVKNELNDSIRVLTPAVEKSQAKPFASLTRIELSSAEKSLPLVGAELQEKPFAPPVKHALSNPNPSLPAEKESPLNKAPTLTNKNDFSKTSSEADQSTPQLREESKDDQEEVERDIMEEALVLLNESHAYWVTGELEDALEMLDQAYALLLDTNGNPDIARQKDDLRLMISKRILAIYNSIQTTAKGQRSEVPVITNADIEKEIHQFQTVERDFFISSYQRSAMFRPIMLRELKKAGLPEELSWLPLVESGFKISALSTARALGLWQFIPSTGYKYGLNRDDWVDERMDIEKSTRAAIDYLKELHTMFGDWLTVLAAYNCGEGRVMRTIAAQHLNYLDRFWDLYHQLPYETARYVPRFLATLLIIKNPQKYGIDLGLNTEMMPSLSYEVVEINKCMRLEDIAQKLETSAEMLNTLNAELRYKITPDRTYNLKVPLGMSEKLIQLVDEIQKAEIPRASFLTKRGTVIRHKVRRGETIASIARKYNISVGTITAYNHLTRKQRLVIGKRLIVPIQTVGMSSSYDKMNKLKNNMLRYEVQKGDTLGSLARRYDMTVTEIMKSNRLDSDVLKIGQMLRIQKDHSDSKQGQKNISTQTRVGQEKGGITSVSVKNTGTTNVRKYTVKKGDSLNNIARENNISLDELIQLNRLARKDSIYPGQIIRIQ